MSVRFPLFCAMRLFVMAVTPYLAMSSKAAPQVHVFEEEADLKDSTVQKGISTTSGTYKLLMIPVVCADTGFDANNNLLDNFDPGQPDLRQSLIDRMEEVADLWHEASFGLISLETTVLSRYYQLALPTDEFYHPSYVEAGIIGRPVISDAATVPSGVVTLRLHLLNSPDEDIALEVNGGGSPYTHESLQQMLQSQVDADKLEIIVSADDRLRIMVVRRHVDAGVYVHVLDGESDDDVVEALGLDAGAGSANVVIARSVDSQFPMTNPTEERVGIRLLFESGNVKDFIWVVPANENLNNAAAFVGAHGTEETDATVSVADEELRFELEFNAAEKVTGIQFDAKDDNLDPVLEKWGFSEALWGLDTLTVFDGVVSHARRDTLKVTGRLLAGQAIAAYMLNELTRPPSGPDSIPNTDITEANENALNDLFEDALGGYDSIQTIFLDLSGKRSQASHGSIDAGIENGDYLFTFQTYSDVQVSFSGTGSATLTHETGHNIGFPDLYDNSSGNYDPLLVYPADWDVMDNSHLHHPGAWNKEFRAQWVTEDGGGIDVFPEPAAPGAETRRYVITPLEFSAVDYDANLVGVPGDHDLVKIVRLPLGYGDSGDDHFLLIEARQKTATFEQGLPIAPGATDAGGVYITDCISTKQFDYFEITTRNYVHPLTDKPLLPENNATPLITLAPNNSVNLEAAYPAYSGITINVTGELMGSGGARSYMVEITRQQNDFLDLRIAPWGAPPYESPDIWIEHGDKAELSDDPLEGNGESTRWDPEYDPDANDGQPLDWVRVSVENNGTVEARDVQVRVQVNQPGGIGDTGSWEELPLSDAKTIGAGADAIFSIPWNPTVGEHTCLKAEVFRWDSNLGDLTPANNGAQENVNDFQPTSNSPWKPSPFQVEVFNPFDRSLDISLVAEAVPYGMKVSIADRSFNLPPRTSIVKNAVLTIDDTVYSTPQTNSTGGLTFVYRNRAGTFQTTNQIATQFHVVGYVAPDGDFDVPIGGVTYNVHPTTTTKITFNATAGGCDTFVVAGSTAPAAGNQHMEVEMRYPSGRVEWIPFKTATNGTFFTAFAPKEGGNLRVAVVYPPGGLFAATRSEEKVIVNPRFTVLATVVPPGSGTVTGTNCYSPGDTAILTAKPNPAFVFAGWTNKFTDRFVAATNVLSIVVTTNHNYYAAFAADPKGAMPDLIVEKLSAPSPVRSAANLSGEVILRIGNRGSADATNVTISLYLSTDATLDSRDSSIIQSKFQWNTVAKGMSYTLPRTVSLILPNVVSGEYHLIAVVDENNGIQELSERNNLLASTITVSRGTTYDEWLRANRYAAGNSTDDDDKDGLQNLAEFYFNQNPVDAQDRKNLPQIVKNGAALELKFGRSRETFGVDGTLELATVLGGKSPWREAIEDKDYRVTSIIPTGDEEQVTYQIVPSARRATFYRFAIQSERLVPILR